ncbi:hypothetical protein MMC17_004379 [Xylographa soralifera]|nr:hypothetical protein [Xylographa soralifera]
MDLLTSHYDGGTTSSDQVDVFMPDVNIPARPDLRGVRHDAKWDLLKPFLARLYLKEQTKLANLMQIMHDDFGFNALEHEYKYRFGKWKWKRSIPSVKKNAMLDILQTRANTGKTTELQHLGKALDHSDLNKLRRHLKTNMRCMNALTAKANGGGMALNRMSGPALVLGNSVFLNWNLPYEIMLSLNERNRLYPSPPAPQPASLDLVAVTPTNSPTITVTQALSPLLRVQSAAQAFKRTQLFVQGRHAELVKSMGKPEQQTMSTWLYQFWFFAFKTAKHWGHGPLQWDAEKLAFDLYPARNPLSISSSPLTGARVAHCKINVPSLRQDLCHYTIHCDPEAVFEDTEVDITIPSAFEAPDLLDEQSWRAWPDARAQAPLQERLLNGLEHNQFSTTKTEMLAIDVPELIRASHSSDQRFLEESLGFAIIGRNHELVESLVEKIDSEITGFYPYHLATTYLDGSRTCCNILSTLLNRLREKYRHTDTNNLGHTVFENLMITILRSHTSIRPTEVDDSLRDEKRFPGEETDICGRWDADSECYRSLLAAGISVIPFEWKHKFCHTSALTICHSLATLFDHSRYLFLKSPCELFSKHCTLCGLKAKLYPLHVTVLVAFNLAQYGTQDEDLFGMIAVILCILAMGAPQRYSISIPLSLYLGKEYSDPEVPNPACDHEKLNPAQLAASIPDRYVQAWSEKAQTGWRVLCLILQVAQSEAQGREAQEPEADNTEADDTEANDTEADDTEADDTEADDQFCTRCENIIANFFGKHKALSVLWAAVQTELLTYRRLHESNPWISDNFDIQAVLRSLEDGGDTIAGKLTVDGLMKALCSCGSFDSFEPFVPRAKEVSQEPISNLEKRWDLLRVIEPPSRGRIW